MCNNNENSNCQCIAEILTVISILQQNATCCSDACLDTCDRGFLGCSTTTLGCNTRPIMLYTCCANASTPLTMPTSKEDVTGENTSSVFRVEKIDGCCATFRVLAPNPDVTAVGIPYVATNSFFTTNLNCVCCLRCLQDTYVECI